MKKKGLIVATIVMVLVLAVSITTATYAWFSSTAQATVENISVLTVQNEGLQIAVKTAGGSYISGDMDYNTTEVPNDWSSTVDDWGTVVNFAAVSEKLGSISSAVTYVKDSAYLEDLNDKVYKVAAVTSENFTEKKAGLSIPAAVTVGDDAGKTLMTAVTADFDASTTYYEVDSSVAVGDFLSPIGYNTIAGELVPYAFTKANENGVNGYLDLPIAVRATTAMDAVLCSLTITPDQGTASAATWNNYKPGMAAALRVTISDGTNSLTIAPYNNVSKSGSAFANANETPFTLDFIVAYGQEGKVTALAALELTYTVWIEGEDEQCIDIVTGTGAKVDLKYGYIPANESGATWTNITTAGSETTDTTVGYTANSTGYVEYDGTSYYAFGFTKSMAA